jgi:periplasmic protein TonB
MLTETAIAYGRLERSRWSAWGVSLTVHIVTAAVALWTTTVHRSPSLSEAPDAIERYELVWFPGLGSDRGGGGERGDETPLASVAQLPGADSRTVPSAALTVTPQFNPPPPPESSIDIPATPLASALHVFPGVIEATALTGITRGPGRGERAGSGEDGGIGAGDGRGAGPGSDLGIGGGPYEVGAGVSRPQLLREVRPNYTADAMRAKVQGVVLVECVVLADGSVGNVRILRSLDGTFGLDEEAVKAARQWRFVPGTRRGEPVPVVITIEIAFTLR